MFKISAFILVQVWQNCAQPDFLSPPLLHWAELFFYGHDGFGWIDKTPNTTYNSICPARFLYFSLNLQVIFSFNITPAHKL